MTIVSVAVQCCYFIVVCRRHHHHHQLHVSQQKKKVETYNCNPAESNYVSTALGKCILDRLADQQNRLHI